MYAAAIRQAVRLLQQQFRPISATSSNVEDVKFFDLEQC